MLVLVIADKSVGPNAHPASLIEGLSEKVYLCVICI